MRVGIATDHGGFSLKEELIRHLRAAGHEIVDFGAYALDADDDYPDFVVPLARAVVAGEVRRGVAICGSGVGASVCANKVAGIRAALIHDHFSARQGVEDDHLNILCMGGRTVGPAVAWDLVQTFLRAEFSRAERHLRRLGKVARMESYALRRSSGQPRARQGVVQRARERGVRDARRGRRTALLLRQRHSAHLLLDEPLGYLPHLELQVFGVDAPEHVEKAGDQPGPPRLMARA
jgi:ribose 5-phosphate isomerase B